MIKRPFFGLKTPRFHLGSIAGEPPAPVVIGTPEQITLYIDGQAKYSTELLINKGDPVKIGQKISLMRDSDAYSISTVSGVIASITPLIDESGRPVTAVSIDVSGDEAYDDTFESCSDNPTLTDAINLLGCLPGNPAFKPFAETDKPIQTIVVNAVDQDLFIITALYALKAFFKELKIGINRLKSLTGIGNIVLAAPIDAIQGYGDIGASVIPVDTAYPEGMPLLIARRLLDQEIPAGKDLNDLGIAFMPVESVVSLGRSFSSGKMTVTKLFTFIDKQGNRALVSATIGTPIRDVLKAFQATVKKHDRIIMGGPLTGCSVYSADLPIRPDTTAILVQDSDDIAFVSDTPCINCGDCIRICPARIPINLLVRFLEAGQYEEAAENYDLFSCIDCGLCSFVCVSRIPVFQYIKLAKHELSRVNSQEISDE